MAKKTETTSLRKRAGKNGSRRSVRKMKYDTSEPRKPRLSKLVASDTSSAGSRTPSRKSGIRRAVKTTTGRETQKAKAITKFEDFNKIKPTKNAKRDDLMALGRGWRISPNGSKVELAATLLFVRDLGDRRLAMFKY